MAMTLDDVNLADLDTFVPSVPHDMFDVLRREAPVWYHPATNGVEGFWCIVKHHDLMDLSRDYPHASSARGGITLHDMTEEDLEMQRMMMLQMDPPNHTKLRLLVNKGFTPRMVGRLDQHIRDIAASIVDDIAARGECDFVVDVAAELPLQVIAEMMGVPVEDRHKIFEWSNQMIGSDDPEYSVTREDAIGAATEMFPIRRSWRRRSARTRVTTSSARSCRPRSTGSSSATPSSTSSSSCSPWRATRRRAT
jgi:cholest-4-en-3-one 26-monooxygenase